MTHTLWDVCFSFCWFLFLCFFLVYFWALLHIFLFMGTHPLLDSFICILAIMGEMYQVHQFVVLNPSLSLNLKTLHSTQVHFFHLLAKRSWGPEVPPLRVGISGGCRVSALRPESPSQVVSLRYLRNRAGGFLAVPPLHTRLLSHLGRLL